MKKNLSKQILLISILSLLTLGIFHLNTQADAFSITGKVMDYGNIIKPIIGATVTLNQGETLIDTQTTDSDGNYTFSSVTSGLDYTISVTKLNEPHNTGIATNDLTFLRQHLVGNEITNIYQLIATNVLSNTHDINTIDLNTFRNQLIGNITSFDPIWRFFDQSQIGSLTDTNYLQTSYQEKSIPNLSADLINQDFIAVKIGDVDNSWGN